MIYKFNIIVFMSWHNDVFIYYYICNFVFIDIVYSIFN